MAYITAAMEHYSDSDVYAVDVVNEILDSDGNIHETCWSDIDDFMCKAFKAARDANPTIELFYNDFNIAPMNSWYKTKSDAVYNMIAGMKARGGECPIDGIKFQTHISLSFSDSNVASVRENVQRYAELGIKVHFTEVDVKCA